MEDRVFFEHTFLNIQFMLILTKRDQAPTIPNMFNTKVKLTMFNFMA